MSQAGPPFSYASINTLTALHGFGEYPPTGGLTPARIAEEFAAVGVRQVSCGAWAYMTSIRPFFAARVRGTEFEEMARLVEDKTYDPHFSERLRRELERRGVASRAGRIDSAPKDEARPQLRSSGRPSSRGVSDRTARRDRACGSMARKTRRRRGSATPRRG